MKRTKKRILTIGGVIISILLLSILGFYFKIKSEMKEMNVIETKQIAKNIFAVNNSFVNMFLVKDSDFYVAIDAGNDKEMVTIELKKLNINPDKVVAVMLTHTDGDHTAALQLFKNAKIYLARQEEQMINGTTSKFLFIGNKLSCKNYNLLDNQQIINVGNLKIKGILTPGHTPGSICYLINDKYLFVGDAFGLKNGKLSNPNELFSMDMKTGIQSMAKIKHLLKAEYIFTAHNEYSDNYKIAVK
ncbi:MAG: MBL fold metallo-hydrolase [Paludibacter sp.]